MKCLLVLAPLLVLASAQYLNLNVDPSATNDYDLNRLISQVLTQAAAIQPEFTAVEQKPDPSSQQYRTAQIEYASPSNSQEQQPAPERARGTQQVRDQYRAPEQQQPRVVQIQETQASSAPLRPNIVRNEYVIPSKQNQEYVLPNRQKESRNDYSSSSRKTQERKDNGGGSTKNFVRNEYKSVNINTPVRENVRSGYNTPPISRQRQNVVLDEFISPPEQQQLKELSELETQEDQAPIQRLRFIGRSQQQGGYSSTNGQSARSNDLVTASSGSYYRDSQINSFAGGHSENLNFLGDIGGIGNQGGEIKKFVYIHTAPPELREPPRPIQRIKAPAPETHYNIIFVKTPSPPREEPPEIELPSPPLQKTLVYVLLKKPSPPPEIRIPPPVPTAPSKPEVYFIRYNDNKNLPINNNGDQGPLPFDEEADLGLNNNQFYETPRGNLNDGGYGGDGIENNVGAYSEPRKVSNSKKSSSKSKSSQKNSHYTAPGSRPFESQSQDSIFKPLSNTNKSGNRSRNQSQSSSGGY